MSGRYLFLPLGYPRAILGNGLGRVVCQLQRITIKFCKSNGSSRGVREFIEQDLVGFAKENPGIVIYLKPRRHRCPVFVSEYLNGERKWMPIENFSRNEVRNWLELMKTQSGIPDMKLLKTSHTDNPSIQGPWNPFLFRNPDLNLVTFPDEKYSLPENLSPTATEEILELFKQQKLAVNQETLKEVQHNADLKKEV